MFWKKSICIFKLIFLLYNLFLNCNFLIAMNQPQMDMNLPVLSEEEFKNLSPEEQQSYMQAVTENIFQNLSPEQQEEVQQEIAKIEAMSDEERESYLKQVEKDLEKAFEEEKNIEKPQKPIQEEVVKEPIVDTSVKRTDKKEKKVIDKEKEAQIKQAVTLINETIVTIDSFETKIFSIQNFKDRFSKWIQRKKINVQINDFSWNMFNEKVQIFKQQLYLLKDRDTKTKKYKHIPALLKNESLYAQLYTFSTSLDEYVSQIISDGEAASTSIKKKSNKAIKIAIDLFINNLFNKQNIIDDINIVLQSYTQTAKKISGQESSLEKKALNESKKSIRQTPVRLAGQKEQFAISQDMPDDYFQGIGSTPSTYTPQAKTAPGLSKSDPKNDKEKKNSKDKINKEDKEDKDKKSKLSSEQLMEKLNSILENISLIFKETQRLDNIFDTVKNNVKDFNLVQNYIPKLNALTQQAQEIIIELEEQFKIEKIENNIINKYKKGIKVKISKLFVKLNNLQNDIKKLYTEVNNIKLSLDTIWAYKAIDKTLEFSSKDIKVKFDNFIKNFESEFITIVNEAFSRCTEQEKKDYELLSKEEKEQFLEFKIRQPNKQGIYRILNNFNNIQDEQLENEFTILQNRVQEEFKNIINSLTDTENDSAKTTWENLIKKIEERKATEEEQKKFQTLQQQYFNQAINILTEEEKKKYQKIEFVFVIKDLLSKLNKQTQTKLKIGNLKLLTINELQQILNFVNQQKAMFEQNIKKNNEILQSIKEKIPSPVALNVLQKNIQNFLSTMRSLLKN